MNFNIGQKVYISKEPKSKEALPVMLTGSVVAKSKNKLTIKLFGYSNNKLIFSLININEDDTLVTTDFENYYLMFSSEKQFEEYSNSENHRNLLILNIIKKLPKAENSVLYSVFESLDGSV